MDLTLLFRTFDPEILKKESKKKEDLEVTVQLLQKSTDDLREKNVFLESRKLKMSKDMEILEFEGSEKISQYDKAIKEAKQTLFALQKEAARLTRASRRLSC
eukprot:GHVP01010590.1.p2 GENE.GHVP01010590.1~~GHVP01010590.1.p2  ORF type:complete len:102 (-),score=31.01 GHVP01010590.1:68-373(-)